MYQQTHSTRWMSLSLLFSIGAASLLAPIGGWVGDRFDRRKVMVGSELAAAVVIVTLALVHTPPALLALGLASAAIGTVFGPASGAAVGHVAGEQQLAYATSVIATGSTVGKTTGRLVAGAAIAAFGAGSVFLMDALTFVISASLIASLRRGFSESNASGAPAREEEPQDARGQVGIRYVLSHNVLRPVVAAACISTFATAFSMTAEVPLVFEMGAGAVGLGALTACWTVGMLVSTWLVRGALHSGNEATAVLIGRLAMAAGVGLVAMAPTLAPALGCYLFGGAGGGLMGVAAQSLIVRNTPDRLRARVLGAIDACRNVTFGVGVVLAGTLVGLTGPRPIYGLVGVTMAIGALPVARLVLRLGGPQPLRAAPEPAGATV